MTFVASDKGSMERQRLSRQGQLEVVETNLGGKERNKHERCKLHAGRGAAGKAAVVGA